MRSPVPPQDDASQAPAALRRNLQNELFVEAEAVVVRSQSPEIPRGLAPSPIPASPPRNTRQTSRAATGSSGPRNTTLAGRKRNIAQVDLTDENIRFIRFNRTKVPVQAGAILPFVKREYIAIVKRVTAALRAGSEHRTELEDIPPIVKSAILSRFLNRDEEKWLPLLEAAQEELGKELKKLRGMAKALPREKQQELFVNGIVMPMEREMKEVNEAMDRREKLIADLEEHIGEA